MNKIKDMSSKDDFWRRKKSKDWGFYTAVEGGGDEWKGYGGQSNLIKIRSLIRSDYSSILLYIIIGPVLKHHGFFLILLYPLDFFKEKLEPV